MKQPNHNRPSPDISPYGTRSKGRSKRSWIPFVMVALFIGFVLKEQVPAVNDRIQAVLNPASFQAIKVCREAALSQSETPAFARLIRLGEAQATQNGYFVDGILLGEMDVQGGERQMAISCHVDALGDLVKAHREQRVFVPPMPESAVEDE